MIREIDDNRIFGLAAVFECLQNTANTRIKKARQPEISGHGGVPACLCKMGIIIKE